MTNQIRITLGLQGQQQVAAGLKQTAQDTTALGTAAAGISAELVSVTNQLRAMGAAAALASQQFAQVRLEQAGLATTAGSLGQRLRQQNVETAALTSSNTGLSGALGGVAGAARVAVPALAAMKLLTLAGDAVEAAARYQVYAERIELVSGNAARAQERLAFLRAETDRLGTSLLEGSDNFSVLLSGTGDLSDATRNNIFSVLTQAGERYKLTQEQNSQNFEQLVRLAGKAKITLDDLGGALGKNLPMALDVTARGLGVSSTELRRMISQGEVAGRDILPAIATGFSEAFGLGPQREITTARSEVQRLNNELLQVATALSQPVSTAFTEGSGTVAGYFANLIKFGRSGSKADALLAGTAPISDFAIGTVNTVLGTSLPTTSDGIRGANAARDYVLANPFRPALYDPSAPRSRPFYGPGQPAFGLVGENLLSFGQPSAEERAKAQRKADAEHAAALREQERIAAALTRDAEQALQTDLRREETLRERVADVRIEAELIAEQLRTGKAITGAARELFVLQRQAADPATGQLRTELAKLAALEQQVQLQKEGERLAREATAARERADRQAESYLRRREPGFESRAGEGDPNPISRLDAVRASLRGREEQEFQRQMRLELSAREAERAAGTDDYAAFAEREEALAQAHADRLLEIDRQYAVARIAVFTSIADGTATVLDQLGQLAQNFGAKGFAAYKAFAIAETLISTYSSAQKSYESLASIPVVGPVLGGIAAATAVANGLAQVGRIRGLQPAGRRFGGAVSAGQMVELNEGGISEVYRDARSGRQYFIPGNSGEVTPAKAMSGSMGAAAANDSRAFDSRPLIQVFEQTGSVGVRTQTQRLGRKDVVRIFVEELGDNASPVSRGVQGFSGRKVAGGVG